VFISVFLYFSSWFSFFSHSLTPAETRPLAEALAQGLCWLRSGCLLHTRVNRAQISSVLCSGWWCTDCTLHQSPGWSKHEPCRRLGRWRWPGPPCHFTSESVKSDRGGLGLASCAVREVGPLSRPRSSHACRLSKHSCLRAVACGVWSKQGTNCMHTEKLLPKEL